MGDVQLIKDDLKATYNSRRVLASGRLFEADGLSGDNSKFAELVIHHLTNNNSEKLWFSELAYHVTKNITIDPETIFYPREGPLMSTGHQGGDFYFHKKGIKEELLWKSVAAKDTPAAYSNYLELYPDGKYARQSVEKIKSFNEGKFWSDCLESNSEMAYQEYLSEYPTGNYLKEANALILALNKHDKSTEESLKIEEKRDKFCYQLCSTKADFEKYIELFPYGKNVEAAYLKIKRLSGIVDFQLIKELESMIAKKTIEKTINILLGIDSKFYDEILDLAKRWSMITVKEMKKMNGPGDETEKAKISDSLLELLRKIEKDLKGPG